MPPLPAAFSERMQSQLGNAWDSLAATLEERAPTSLRWNKRKSGLREMADQEVPWCEHGAYLASRPNFALDPQWHAGAYYVQEPSSMFLEWVWKRLPIPDRPLLVLDMCAAPGGKTTHLIDLVPDGSLVIANEVIKSRLSVLEENLVKWGYPNIMITSADPDRWTAFAGLFDVVLVDAPCSGEGLFRKEPNSRLEWSTEQVRHCVSRQNRILEAAAKLVRPDGYLIYSTCTWAPEENEGQLDFLLTKGFKPVQSGTAPFEVETSVSKDGAVGYRMYPHKLRGEGFFCSALQKVEASDAGYSQNTRGNTLLPVSDEDLKSRLLKNPADYDLIDRKGIVTAIPGKWQPIIEQIAGTLPTRVLGLALGQWKGTDFIPHPHMAFSVEHRNTFPEIDLEDDYPEGLNFLAKRDFKYDGEVSPAWNLVSISGNGLGWVKVLPNRVNNYYPTHWRLRNPML